MFRLASMLIAIALASPTARPMVCLTDCECEQTVLTCGNDCSRVTVATPFLTEVTYAAPATVAAAVRASSVAALAPDTLSRFAPVLGPGADRAPHPPTSITVLRI
jgi:hypothetical protein